MNIKRTAIFRTVVCLALAMGVIFPAAAAAAPNWGHTSWQYRQEITVLNTEVPGDLSDFPVLVDITHTGLRDHALANGDDILVTTADGITQVSHEIESYDSGTGALIAWMKAPAVSSGTDTDFYIYYGNPGASNQEDINGVWGGSYKAVYHLPDKTSSTLNDSTINGNDATKSAADEPVESAGKIGLGQSFDGSDDTISSAIGALNAPFTVEAWGYFNQLEQAAGDYDYVMMLGTGSQMVSFARNAVDEKFYSYSESVQKFGPVLGGQQWLHLVGVYDSVAPYHKLYINGTSVSVDDFSAAMTGVSGAFIGGEYGPGNTHRLNGKVDEVRISDATRSADWIATSFNNQDDPAGFFNSPLAAVEEAPNTLAGSNVNVNLGGGIEVTFDTVSGDGNTTVTVGGGPGGNPSGFTILDNSFDITTTAGFSGNIVVTVPYDEGSVAGDEADVQLFRWNGSAWQDVTVSVNTSANTVTGSYTSLSWWGAGAPIYVPPTGVNTSLLGALSLMLMGSGGAILRRRLSFKP